MPEAGNISPPSVPHSECTCADGPCLSEQFDCVIMLTWSNWRTEPRSNRYHYATRFARSLPVLFVQPDGIGTTWVLEETEIPGITIVHIPPETGAGMTARRQSDLLGKVLRLRGILRPLIWIYNPYFTDFVQRCHAPLRVYHATEDYFTCDRSAPVRDKVTQMVEQCDLVIAVSNGVADSYRQNTQFSGPIHVAPNGCDYASFVAAKKRIGMPGTDARIAIFQGGINWRIDFDLLLDLTTMLSDWEFNFCGQEYFDPREETEAFKSWQALQAKPNVHYLGYLSASETADAMCRSSVGLIPFVRDETIMERSLPLKAFEYVACGLPVVSIPIRELAAFPELFSTANNAREFADRMIQLRETRRQDTSLTLRAEGASLRSFDSAFDNVGFCILNFLKSRPICGEPLQILIFFDPDALAVSEIAHQLGAFQTDSRHKVMFFPLLVNHAIRFDVTIFDVLFIHESLLSRTSPHLPASLSEAIDANPGFKALLASPGHKLEKDMKALCKTLGLNCDSSISCTCSGAVEWGNWLESMVPHRRRARLFTVLAGFELDRSRHWHSVLETSQTILDDVPRNTPRRLTRAWHIQENPTPRNWKDWLPQFLRPPVRLLRRLLRRQSKATRVAR